MIISKLSLNISICLSYTFNGDSVGANNLELFLHFSINVNLPVFPVAVRKKIELEYFIINFGINELTYHGQVQTPHPEN